jgi:hypothetical protein
MREREVSGIHLVPQSGKGIPLYRIGHKNCYQADYMLGPGPRLIKKNYRAAVSQRLRNTGLERMSAFTRCDSNQILLITFS